MNVGKHMARFACFVLKLFGLHPEARNRTNRQNTIRNKPLKTLILSPLCRSPSLPIAPRPRKKPYKTQGGNPIKTLMGASAPSGGSCGGMLYGTSTRQR